VTRLCLTDPQPSVLVDRALDRGEDRGNARHFVEDDPRRKRVDERIRIVLRRRAVGGPVEGAELEPPSAVRDGAREDRLPALPRPLHEHDGRVGDGFGKPRPQMAGEHGERKPGARGPIHAEVQIHPIRG